jgi:putative aminopeptidase FrvX
MTAVSGFEQAMADSLLQLLPGTVKDRAGNVVAVLGSGRPVRLVACPMDEWGYVVGNIRDDGYVTLRRVGRGAPPQFDQGHEGHRVTVWGASGPVPAVVGVPSTHLRRGREGRDPFADRLFTVDDAMLDLGASSDAMVRALGVGIVDPVALEKRPHRYGDGLLAGPEAGQRGSCAALAQAYLDRPRARGTVVAAFVVESRIGHRGLSTLTNARGPFDATLLLDYPAPERLITESYGSVERVRMATRYDGWPVETVARTELEVILARIKNWMEAEHGPNR